MGDSGQGAVRIDLIGGDPGCVVAGCGSGLGDDSEVIRSVVDGEGTGSWVCVHDDRREPAVGLDVKGIEIVGDALCHEKEPSIGAKGQRCSAAGGAGEKLR